MWRRLANVSACIQGRRPGLGGPREQPSPPPGPLLGQGPYSFYRQVVIWLGPHRLIIPVIISSTAHSPYGQVIFRFKFTFCLLSWRNHSKHCVYVVLRAGSCIIQHHIFYCSGSVPQPRCLSGPRETWPQPASASSRKPHSSSPARPAGSWGPGRRRG